MFDTAIPMRVNNGAGYATPAKKLQVPYQATGGGSQYLSRMAMANAAAQKQSTLANKAIEDNQVGYLQQSQAARAGDVQSQRENQMKIANLGLQKQTVQRQIAQEQSQKTKDIAMQVSQSQQDAASRRAQGIFNMLIGSGLLTSGAGMTAGGYMLGRAGGGVLGRLND